MKILKYKENMMSTKIENVETFVNEFWMFEGEPFRLVRYKCDGVSYLCGFSDGMLILDSLSIATSRGGLYLYPTKEHIEQLQEHFNAGLSCRMGIEND